MKRREFIWAGAVLPLLLQKMAAESTIRSTNHNAAWQGAPNTPVLDRYRLTLNRVLHGTAPAYTPDFLLEDLSGEGPRRFTNFSGDVSGRWIGSLSSSASVFGDTFPQLDEFVRRAIALQHSEGYFGRHFNYEQPGDDDLALLWGNGRLLVGLMEYYKLTHNTAALKAATKIGGFLLRIAPKYNSKSMADEFNASHFASSYICWTQQTEGLALLFKETGDRRYADLCSQIGDRAERRPQDHVHGYLCSLRGTLLLYEATKDQRLLNQVETKWADVFNSGDVLITGGVPEAWSPKRLRTEGCAECDWLRLNLHLWQLTGKPQYIRMAERTLFNEFQMNQFQSGDFGHALLDAGGVPERVAVKAWWCCTFHGLRAFSDIASSAFRPETFGASFNLPIDGVHHADQVKLRSVSTLATNGRVSIHVEHAEAGRSLSIRKPEWAELRVTRNGASSASEGLPLRNGDVIEVTYVMHLRQETQHSAAGRPNVALLYGPWLLGASSEVNPQYFNELQGRNKLELASVKPTREAAKSPYSVPAAATSIRYFPAEYPEQPQTVELRAVSEQTFFRPASWQLVFEQ